MDCYIVILFNVCTALFFSYSAIFIAASVRNKLTASLWSCCHSGSKLPLRKFNRFIWWEQHERQAAAELWTTLISLSHRST